ncbi:dihydrofolate reductase [Thiorhodococcus minor]|uniref:Dihydrofolate reductase n=1 Tax=Thiorhodococcus minor TaxID=57489 RepID=A0A6M0JX20_9GAMM|nr:dihydrofolate reductase [Thiorhodococcus minor]NEV62050.1 dihydrofolate reductase [Thiorhodococcus minor]
MQQARARGGESRPSLAVVAAVADNGVIGRDNTLPWRLPADLAHFRQLTLGKSIVMGRRTWESLPGLLPRRRHIVLTRDPQFRAEGCVVLTSLDAAIAETAGEAELMVVGGASLYAEAIPLASRLHLTLVHTQAEGDTYFPEWDSSAWREVSRVARPRDARNAFEMSFLELERMT